MRLTRFFLVLLLAFGNFAMGQDARPIDVYLLGGQSNMQGSGTTAELSAEERTPQKNAYYWNGNEFEPLVPGVTKTNGKGDHFGPEISFAKTIAAKTPERDVYIVKHSLSGQPLHFAWNGSEWAGEKPGPKRKNFSAGDSANDPNIGLHYKSMIAVYSRAIAHLRERKREFTIRGMLWMQGEQDAKHELSAAQWGQELKRLRDRTAADLKTEPFPLAFGQVLPHTPAMPRFTHRTELRETMRIIDQDSGDSQAIPGFKMVSTDGFPLKSDTVHYDTAGQVKLGVAFAEAIRELVKAK